MSRASQIGIRQPSESSVLQEGLRSTGCLENLRLARETAMIIGIVGSRRRDTQEDFEIVERIFLSVYKPGDTICSGLCPKGADRFAVILAEKYHSNRVWYPAEWSKYGRMAGFKRNSYIAKDSDVLIACVAPDRTGGAEDTVRKYLKAGKNKLVLC